MIYKNLVRPLLFQLDSETVHHWAVRCARLSALPLIGHGMGSLFGYRNPLLECEVFGHRFANPLGLAAGFDKNGEILPFLSQLGFGHIEVGTVTPLSQSGNPLPRIFRISSEGALINRMGFPSAGCSALERRLQHVVGTGLKAKIAINIGKNKNTELDQAHLDYEYLGKHLAKYACWLTINVSSPNTPGLRSLQTAEALRKIVESIRKHPEVTVPLLVKLSPDLEKSELHDVLDALRELRCDGVIASNTTLQRDEVLSVGRNESSVREQGGLSGRPLFSMTRKRIVEIREYVGESLPLIAVGGVTSWQDFVTLIIEGATLVQGYTALVYEGPGWPERILRGATKFCKSQGISSIEKLRGRSELTKLF